MSSRAFDGKTMAHIALKKKNVYDRDEKEGN